MADIELSVGLTDEEVRDKAKSLQKEIEDIFKKTSNVQVTSDFNKLKTNMDKAYSTAVQLKNQMDKMIAEGKSYTPTEQYTQLNEKLREEIALHEEILKVIDEQRQVGIIDADKLNDAEAKLKEIRDLEQQIKDLEASGEHQVETKQYEDLKNKLGGVNNQMYQYIDAAHEMDRAGKVAADGTQKLGTESDKTKVMMKQLGNNLSNYIVSGLNNMVHSLDKGITKVAQFSAKTVLAFAKLIPGVRTATKLFNKMKDSFSGMSDSIAKQVPSISKLIKLFLRWGLGIRSVFILWRKLRTYAIDAIKAMAKQIEEVNVDVSNLINTFNQFKMSLGTLVQPLMHALAPAIIYIINLLISAANALANFFAILTGQKYIYKAVKANDKFGDSIGGVGSAAKEANEELAEYDNLLVIDQDTPGGGGGGGGGAADDIAGTFEKVIAESDFAKALRESIEKGDWYGVGVVLGDKLNSLVNVVDDWIINKFEPMGKEFARRLALILNGAIATIDFAKIGKTLADGINAVFRIADEFLTTFDFKTFGIKVGEGINGFIDYIDAKAIGQTLVDAINKAIEFALNLGQTIHWIDLGSKLAELFNTYVEGFHAEELGEAIHTWISGALDTAITFFTDADFEELGNKIGEFLEGLKIDDLAGKLFTLAKKVVESLADAIDGIADTPEGEAMLKIAAALAAVFLAIKSITIIWDVALKSIISTAISELISSAVTKGSLSSALGSAITKGTSGLGKLTLTIGEVLLVFTLATIASESIKKVEKEIAEELWGDKELGQYIEEYGGLSKLPEAWLELFDGMKESINDSTNNLEKFIKIAESLSGGLFGGPFIEIIADWLGFNDVVSEVGENIKNTWNSISSSISLAWNSIKSAWKDFKIKNFFEGIVEIIEESFENINDWFAEKFEDAWNKLSEKWNESDVKKHFDKIVEKIKNAFDTSGGKSVADAIGEKFSKAWENVKRAWNTSLQGNHFATIATTIKNKFSGASDIAQWFSQKFSEAWRSVKEAFTSGNASQHFSNIKNTIINIFSDGNFASKIKEKFVTAWNNAKDAWATSTVGKHFSDVAQNIKDKLTGAWDIIKNTFTYQKAVEIFSQVKNGALAAFNGFADKLKAIFEGAWNSVKAAFSTSGQNSVINVVKDTFVNLINKMIDGLNSILHGPFAALQMLVHKLRNWTLPIGGGKPFSGLKDFAIPTIPHLAQGAVIPPNKEFLAVLGDQKQGTNIETPLDTMVEAFKMAMADENSSRNNQPIVLQLNGRTVAEVVWNESEKRYKQSGRFMPSYV